MLAADLRHEKPKQNQGFKDLKQQVAQTLSHPASVTSKTKQTHRLPLKSLLFNLEQRLSKQPDDMQGWLYC